MVATIVLCAFIGLLHPVVSRSLTSRAPADDGIPIPKFKMDFKKGNTSAQWAAGYPKKWGSEGFHFEFNVPEPEDNFNAIITDDEKYLVMFNGSHANVVNLESNATVSTFGLSSSFVETGQAIRSTPQGGYDLFTGGNSTVFQRHFTPDFKPAGELISYAGELRALQGKHLVTFWEVSYESSFNIYDVSSPNRTHVELKSPPAITDISFSSDGQYLSTVGWNDRTADLWNATTGEKILQFPPTAAQNWVTRISPDDKYVFISLGTGFVQIYSLANLTAEPLVLGPFNDWIREIEWSPDSKYLATGDRGRLQLWEFPEVKVVQTWQVDNTLVDTSTLWKLTWLDGGSKISWAYRYGRYMYDFESNLKYWWTPGYDDHSWGGNSIRYLKKQGYVATTDGDSRVRFWRI